MLLSAGTAHAQVREAIVDNDFEVDLLATPASGSSRTIGLGGAAVALAEGVSAVGVNPAGYAARTSWELDWWEYELDLSLQFPGSFSSADYFLNGRGRSLGVNHFLAVEAAGRLQLGNLGFGAQVRIEEYRLRTESRSSVSVSTTRLGGGYAFANGQFVLGGGVRIASFDLTASEAVADGPVPGEFITLVSFRAVGAELGAVLRPEHARWRIGAAMRSPVRAVVVGDEVRRAGGFWIPRAANYPWEFAAGFAYQWLERPLNPVFQAQKNVARGLRARLRERWCAREALQVERERSRGEYEPGAEDSDCNGAPRPSSAAWWSQEQARRDAERANSGSEAERLQDEMGDFQRAIYESRPRRYVLLSADLLILGRTDDGVGIDSFVRQERFRRGAEITVGARVGVETEAIVDRLKLRFGTYFEQARYEDVGSRIHGTAGFDLRLFRFIGTEWRLTSFVDVASRYVNWGVSIGAWH